MTTGLLGIDLGTGSIKALVVDLAGTTRGRGSAEYPLHHPKPGYAEQNPADWWRATVTAVREAVAQAGALQVVAIGLSGQMHGAVPLGADGDPIAPAVIWADTRSAAQVDEITRAVGAERLIEMTGSPLATGFQAATIRWWQAAQPDVWAQTRTVLLPKDWLRFRLTGEISTEPSDASSTLLLDVNRRDWSDDVLAALAIDRSLLPPVRGSGEMSGRLSEEAAVALGLPAGLPVAGGAGDAPAGALGAGIVDPSAMLLTISTGAQVLVPAATPRLDRRGRVHTFCSALPAGSSAPWYVMGATMVAGLAMRWLRDEVFALEPAGAYERMTAWAEPTAPGAGGLVFLPYLAGERTPHMNPHARGVLLGLTAGHGRGHLVRAVMEGTTLALFDAYDVLREIGIEAGTIVLAGGGAQSPLWRQIVADVFGKPVRPLLTVEQSALGAALLAGSAAGMLDVEVTARRWTAYGELVEPSESAHAVYGRLLPIFREGYRKHVEDFEMLAQLT